MTARELVVRSGGVPLRVLDHGGDGGDVLLLHGGGRTGRDWDDVAGRLGALGYRVVAPDLRGHGGTPAAPWSWDAALGDVEAVVAEVALREPAVVGHSLGGMVAALWAARRAGCPLAVNLDGHGNPVRPDQYAGLSGAGAEDAHRAMLAAFAPMADGLTEHFRGVMRCIDELDRFAVYRRACCPLVVVSAQRSMAEVLPQEVRAPWAAYERWVQQQLDAAAAANPNVALVAMPTGHNVHLEAPEAVATLIHERLAAHRADTVGPNSSFADGP